jgi:hypothetical protein
LRQAIPWKRTIRHYANFHQSKSLRRLEREQTLIDRHFLTASTGVACVSTAAATIHARLSALSKGAQHPPVQHACVSAFLVLPEGAQQPPKQHASLQQAQQSRPYHARLYQKKESSRNIPSSSRSSLGDW